MEEIQYMHFCTVSISVLVVVIHVIKKRKEKKIRKSNKKHTKQTTIKDIMLAIDLVMREKGKKKVKERFKPVKPPISENKTVLK